MYNIIRLLGYLQCCRCIIFVVKYLKNISCAVEKKEVIFEEEKIELLKLNKGRFNSLLFNGFNKYSSLFRFLKRK